MSAENVELVKQFTRLFEEGDRSSWRLYFDEDVIWDTSGTSLLLAGVYEGHSGIEQFFSDWLSTWDDFEIQTREWIDAGDSVVVAFRQRGRGKGSGVVIDREFFGVYDIRNRLVVRYKQYESLDAALQAVGLRE